MKVVIIVLTLISSISLGLSSNTIPNSLNFNKLAFAQQNPVLPTYGSIVPTKILYNQTNLASSDIQPKSLAHYQHITPAVHDYTGNSNSKSISRFPTLTTTNMLNSTSPFSFVQPVSLTHYQPIVPVGLTTSLPSPENIGNEHVSTSDGGGGSHHSSNDNGHNGGSHSGSEHHGSSSNNDNNSGSEHHGSSSNNDSNDHRGRTSHHSDNNHNSGSNHHGASASASAGGGHASASASAG